LQSSEVPDQNPHCEGLHVDRRLFNARAKGANPLLFRGYRNDDGNNFTLAAGDSLGIMANTKVAVYESNLADDEDAPLGHLLVSKVESEKSTLTSIAEATFNVPPLFYAKEANFNLRQRLRVFSNVQSHWGPALRKAAANSQQSGLELVHNPKAADLCISLKEDKIVFDRQDQLVSKYLGSRFPHSLSVHYSDSDDAVRVLKCAARFKYHLEHVGRSFDGVRMELHKLKALEGQDKIPGPKKIYKPTGHNILTSEPARVIIDKSFYYGLTIFNNTPIDFYPSVFFFDPSDLSIREHRYLLVTFQPFLTPLLSIRGVVFPAARSNWAERGPPSFRQFKADHWAWGWRRPAMAILFTTRRNKGRSILEDILNRLSNKLLPHHSE
jgi:hypothetical protein